MHMSAGRSTNLWFYSNQVSPFELEKQTNRQRTPALLSPYFVPPHHCRLRARMPQVIYMEDECQETANLFPSLEKALHFLNPDQKEPAHLDYRSAESSGFPDWQLATPTWWEPRLPEQARRQKHLQLGSGHPGAPFLPRLLPPAVSSEAKEESVWTLQGPRRIPS